MTDGQRGWRLAAALLTLATAACGGESGSARRFLSIGTAGTGGVYYPLGGALASRLSVADSRHRYTAEVTGGSVENVNRIATGEMDLGFAMAITVYEGYHGGQDFPRPLAMLRIVAPLYANVTHVLVPRRSAVRSPADLRGRRVSVGSPGSGTEQLARQLLEAYGIAYGDVHVRYLSFRESADALRDGALDAAIFSVGYPASAVLEATTTGDARLVPLDSAAVARLVGQYPYYSAGVIPAGAYPRLDRDLPTLAVMNWIVGTETLDSSVVRHLLRMLRDERDALIRVNEIARQIDLDALRRAPIPLHAAADQWLAEQRGGSRR